MSNPLTAARNPRREAQEIVGAAWAARVLEPSPPTVADGPWFADDPVAADGSASDIMVLPAGIAGASVAGGATTWDDWLADQHPEQAAWAAERWLGGPRQLGPVPDSLADTRQALHRLAAYVIAPARHAATGKFGLRWTRGGFGTPFFADDRQIRVEGVQLVDQVGDQVRAAPITTLRAAAELLDTAIDDETAAEHDTPALGDVDAPLDIDEAAVGFLGRWYGMGVAALEAVRADLASVDPSRPQIWPGHFDPSIEVGDDDHRGSYGASPGDDAIPEPYLYVSLWWPDRLGLDRSDPFWNATTFAGRILRLSDFPVDHDPVEVAARFWLTTRDRL